MIDALKELVQKHWGYGTFRPLQEDAMRAVLDGWIIGRDPDPSVRSEILRDSVGGGPG